MRTMNIRLSGTRYDWIAALHVVVVVYSFLLVWNNGLAKWIMPIYRDNNFFDVFFCGCLGIIMLFAWFLLIGALSGMFLTFDWCNKKLNETRW